MKKNILVFPCGSEVALEIHRSLQYSSQFNLIGASSVDDHGKFIFKNYIGNLPFFTDKHFIDSLVAVIINQKIDAIYPAMDIVAEFLKKNEQRLGCQVIGSSHEANRIAASKSRTYQLLYSVIPCPRWVVELEKVDFYPAFLKPDQSHGSRNGKLAHSKVEAVNFIKDKSEKYVYCEYLLGCEYTIDCFSDRHGKLLFSKARQRARVSNGISVSTYATPKHAAFFKKTAEKINLTLSPRGAWFLQMKENSLGQPVLLEIATRLAGSSSCFRATGVNFALLSALDAFGCDVTVHSNDYRVELDRALGSKYNINIDYNIIYIGFDNCILIDSKINTEVIKFLYQAINSDKKIVLITHYRGDIKDRLAKLKLTAIFDEVIQLKDKVLKSTIIDNVVESIFIDASYRERLAVNNDLSIPVFSPDMVEVLLK